MNIEELTAYCSSFEGAEPAFPFDDVNLVFRVEKKMFAYIPLERYPQQIIFKIEPEENIRLQEEYEAAIPAYHINKKHWVGVLLGSDISDEKLKDLLLKAYQLILKKLPKRKKEKF